MVSIKEIARRCVGLDGAFSLLTDFYGYRGLTGGNDSLLRQVRLLSQGTHINLNIIMVGVDQYVNNDFIEIEAGIRRMRNIYDQVGIAIGRIEYYDITTQMAPGRENIDDDCEAEDLTDEYTIPNNGHDLFMVLTFAGDTIGRSNIDGPCDKKGGPFTGLSGNVIAVRDSAGTNGLITGQVMAHEVGHYLGLEHEDDTSNLMFKEAGENRINLTSEQGDVMVEHCLSFEC